MTLHAILCGLLVGVVGAALYGQGERRRAASKMERRTLRIHGVEREYLLFRPAGERTMPLVLAFHGDSGTAEGMARSTGLNDAAAQRRVMVAYPQGIDGHWGGGRPGGAQDANDLEFVRAIIDDLARHRRANPSRVYATGISNGGSFSIRAGCELADRIAAIAPVAAAMPAALANSSACRSPYPVAMLLIAEHEGKNALPVAETFQFWTGRQGCRGNAVTTKLPPTAQNGMDVTKRVAAGCAPGGDVALYEVSGDPTSPGVWQSLHAPETILDFFLRFERRLPSVLPN
ncbi:MAG: alpha/beta hydrolase family esterase [Bryobacteraceae bacterium]